MLKKRFGRVAVLFGGPSSEREVSLRSGQAVVKGLNEAGYDVSGIDIRDRRLPPLGSAEAVFIALHGQFGEDGGIQALLDKAGIPYTGSGARSSFISFNKAATKDALTGSGVPTPTYQILDAQTQLTLPFPVVAKPIAQGSSLGVVKVESEAEWSAAFETCMKYGDLILVENYVAGRELTVGVVEGEALPVVEIEAPDQWYDYKAKYTRGASRYIVPADIGEETADICRAVALDTFKALECRGFGRVDIRLTPDGRPMVLELNSIPGFTETSLLPMAAASAGMSFSELCGRIMESARYDSAQAPWREQHVLV